MKHLSRVRLGACIVLLLLTMSSCATLDVIGGQFFGEDIRVQAAKVVNSTPRAAEGFYKNVLLYYKAAEDAAELNPSPEATALLSQWNERQKQAGDYYDRFKRVHDMLRVALEDSATSEDLLEAFTEEVLDLVQELAIRQAIREG